MANFDNGELLIMSETDAQSYDETLHSKFQRLLSRTQIASVSIPMELYERETSLVGGSIYATPGTENLLQNSIAIAGNKTDKRKINLLLSAVTGSNYWNKSYDSKNEHLLRSEKLGICNDPYCTTCPTYFKASQLTNQKASFLSEPKVCAFLPIIGYCFSCPKLKNLWETILDAICGRLRQSTYIKGSRILSHSAVVEKMLFVVRVKLESIGEDGTRIPSSEGDACSEELLTWYLEHSSVSTDGGKVRLPGQRLLSDRTVDA